METKVEEEVRDEAGNIGTDIQRESCQEAETSSCLTVPTSLRKEISIFLDDVTALHKSECISKNLLKIMKETLAKIKPINIENCPEVLEATFETVLSQKISLDHVSKFFCTSISRLKRHMLSFAKFIWNPSMCVPRKALFHDITCITDDDRFFEWMLRMRRMGRPPVTNDRRYIKEYLSLSCLPKGTKEFLRKFGKKDVDFKLITDNDVKIWSTMFVQYLSHRCGIIAKNFLARRNSPRIFNCVQLYLSHTHVSNQVISFRGSKNMYSFVSPRQKGVSVMVTYSAAGFYLKPLFMQKNYDMPVWSDQEFIDQSQFHIGATADGQLDPLLFVTWLRLFNAELLENNIEKPVLLFLHGHPCHASLAATTFCQEENIILFSHYHSPLNIMDPFLGMVNKFHFHYDRSLKIFENYIGKDHLTLKYFPVIFLDAWNKMTGNVAMDAFKKSGLVPFNMSVVLENINHDQGSNSVPASVNFLVPGMWVTCLHSNTKTFEFSPQILLPYKHQQQTVSEPVLNIMEPVIANPLPFAGVEPNFL